MQPLESDHRSPLKTVFPILIASAMLPTGMANDEMQAFAATNRTKEQFPGHRKLWSNTLNFNLESPCETDFQFAKLATDIREDLGQQ